MCADENGSGEIDFNEFLVGLWNICTFEDDCLIRCVCAACVSVCVCEWPEIWSAVAFDLIDKDGSGLVDGEEVENLVKVRWQYHCLVETDVCIIMQGVHGSKTTKTLLLHVKKVASEALNYM